MREPKDDAPREEKKASDFTPVGFSDVILPAKTPDNACLISGGREKKGKKMAFTRETHTQIRPPTIPASRLTGVDTKKNAERKKIGKDTRSPPC